MTLTHKFWLDVWGWWFTTPNFLLVPLLTITCTVQLKERKHKLNFKFVINNDFNSQVQSHFLWRNWNIGGDVFVFLFYAPSSVSANNKHKNGFHNQISQ